MSCHVEHRKAPSRPSRRRPARLIAVVAFGGLVIAGVCLCMLYLIDAQSFVDSNQALFAPVTPSPTAIGAEAGGAANQHEQGQRPAQSEHQDVSNDSNVLHPEHHVHRAPTTIHLSWNITRETRSPDGVSKPVYLINGQFPGPVIEARSGDELVIQVHNAVNQHDHPGISIHWHGLSMEGSNELDGVPGLTQCATEASQTLTYQFRIAHHQHGTFWYHAHSALQRADGLYGGLVVHRPVQDGSKGDEALYDYQNEQLLLIGDWYHRTAQDVLEWYLDPDHYGMEQLEPAPDSLLLNGRGRFNCSMAVKARPVECHDVEKPLVRLLNAQRIRLRVINTGVSAAFSMAVSNATMELITVDGGYPVDNETSSTRAIGLLYPGERIDVVLHRTPEYSPSSTHAISTNLTLALDRENMPLWNFALTRTQSFQMQSVGGVRDGAQRQHPRQRPPVDVLDLAHVLGQPLQEAQPGIAKQPSQRAVLYSTMKIRAANHNRPVGSINHTSWVAPDARARPLLTLEREEWETIVPQPTRVHKFQVPWFQESGADTWADVVVNNFDDKGHPFHLVSARSLLSPLSSPRTIRQPTLQQHGYEFFVVARAQGAGVYRGYNPFDAQSVADAGPLNTRNPLRKDTVYIPAMGYVVMRFPLRNDGLWLLHCHVLWHQAVGMGTVIQVGRIAESVKQRSRETCFSPSGR
ncbi:Multicopper oxidase family protein [Metarhizium album ARSEF 1941]|uniref:Laccase 1 n=1 Tax=Metarhizium album (strain ARSEF 1941) TaxID=1081103 RepID=A0A0B2X290_METAS|nr:Multicopper oxidase family protein [Metarhizium album ARSEF 1941]KHN99837.1 Multicopper oxidase family protein [Metarhizium album ARSEF 1941]